MNAQATKSARHVMEIQEARPALPELVRRAVEQDAVTHIGRRRADEAVVVATVRFRRGEEAREILEALSLGPLEALRAALEAVRVRRTADPFASLRALIAGRSGTSATTPGTGRQLSATKISGPEEDREPEGLTWATAAAVGGSARAETVVGGRRPLPASLPRSRRR